MIYVGIDDTDVVGTAGTNQLARAIVRSLGTDGAGATICRHQLFFDPRVPFTSKNGSASIQLPACTPARIPHLVGIVRGVMRAWFIPGSDPGLCIAGTVDARVREFARACKSEVVTRAMARAVVDDVRAGSPKGLEPEGAHVPVSDDEMIRLEGLGGSEQGIIGALAAVGLIASGDDGRVVQLASWPYPDDFHGAHDVGAIRARGVEEIRSLASGEDVSGGTVDIGHHLRPNMRGGRIVLFVERADSVDGPAWRAVKLT